MKDQIFPVESVGHDIRSTQFSRGGCCDTLTANDFKDPTIVAYAIENHPCDSRVSLTDQGVVQTLNARMGTGGVTRLWSCYGVYSHPQASLMKIEEIICPTMTAKMVKGCADGPLILIRRDDR